MLDIVVIITVRVVMVVVGTPSNSESGQYYKRKHRLRLKIHFADCILLYPHAYKLNRRRFSGSTLQCQGRPSFRVVGFDFFFLLV